MMPHVHFFLGVILGDLIKQKFFPSENSIGFIIGSIIPDLDYFFSIFTKKNHRLFFTHYPIFWVSLTIISLIILPKFFLLFLGSIFHILIDFVDWEIYLFMPISKISFSMLNLNFKKISEEKSPIIFLINYYKNSYIIIIETIIFVLFLLTRL